VTSPDDPLTKRKKITWDDLAEARWILNQEGCQYCSYIKRRFEERGQPMRIEVEVIGLELQKKLSQLGLGVALLPSPFVKTEIDSGSLKRLNIVGANIATPSCLVFRSDKYINARMKSFLQLLESGFGPALKI
jgi:DNA-binding transcriptional LysR family regulator